MSDSPEFLIIRAITMSMSWGLMMASAFVVFWLPTMMVIERHETGRPRNRMDVLVFSMSAIAATAFTLSAIRLKFHYYFGVGDYTSAIEWANAMLPVIQFVVLCQIVSYGVHIYVAWNPYTRSLLIFGGLLWVILGAIFLVHHEAWRYDFVWDLTEPSKKQLECLIVP